MSKSNLFETNLLKLIFNNVAIGNIGDSGGLLPSSVAGSLYIALFTDDPSETGEQGNECAYTGYTRVLVDRDTGNWQVTNNIASNINPINFPECTEGDETVTHFAILTNLTLGDILYYGELDVPLEVTNGIIPIFDIGDCQVTEN